MQNDELTEEDIARLKEEERILAERIKKVEETRKPINFFNDSVIKLMEHTPSEILCELGVRAFSGSRDVPKDDIKAAGLFNQA